MSLVEEAYSLLWPEKDFNYVVKEEYNRRLGDYNANISLRGDLLTVKYNLHWKNIDSSIRIGLIQSLLLKIFSKRGDGGRKAVASEFYLELYDEFSKRIPEIASSVVDTSSNCSFLKGSFSRVNSQFFADLVDEPKMVWGSAAVRKLASYNYHNDTVTVSSVFKDASYDVLDLLMYHEILHKVHGFKCVGGRVHSHTPEFKRAEKLYPNKDLVEKKIDEHIRSKSRKKVAVRGRGRKKLSSMKKMSTRELVQRVFGF